MPIRMQTRLSAGKTPITDARGPLDDPDYTEGYIDFEVDGTVLMDHWLSDSIAMLWSTLVEALAALKAGRTGSFSFPDQPIPVELKPLGPRRALISLTIEDDRRVVQADTAELLRVAKAAGQIFFEQWQRLAPDDTDYAKEHLAMLAQI